MGLPLARLTFEEFLVWEADQPERHEFYRGEAFAMVGGTMRHNRVILNLASRLDAHLDGSGCQVFAESMKVRIGDACVLYPDLLVTCGTPLADDTTVITDPKLVIEVLSPSTQGYDKRDKFGLYRRLPSLREYALIDPSERQVEVFTLTDSGAWLMTDQTGRDVLTLASIDAALPMDFIFKGLAEPSSDD